MDETIDNIVEFAMKAVKGYGNSDRYFILEEVCRRLQVKGINALQMEYFVDEAENE